MAVSKEKVKARIKALFPKTNLTQKRLDEISAKLATKPADDASDDDIDQVINDFNENSVMTIEEIAKNDDRIATLARKAAEKPDPTAASPNNDSTDSGDDQDPVKQLLAEVRSMKEELQSYKAQNLKKSLEERFRADERLKDVPEVMFKGRVPQSEEEFDSAVEDLVADWGKLSGTVQTEQEATELARRFGSTSAPAAGAGGSRGTVKQASDDDVSEIVGKLI